MKKEELESLQDAAWEHCLASFFVMWTLSTVAGILFGFPMVVAGWLSLPLSILGAGAVYTAVYLIGHHSNPSKFLYQGKDGFKGFALFVISKTVVAIVISLPFLWAAETFVENSVLIKALIFYMAIIAMFATALKKK